MKIRPVFNAACALAVLAGVPGVPAIAATAPAGHPGARLVSAPAPLTDVIQYAKKRKIYRGSEPSQRPSAVPPGPLALVMPGPGLRGYAFTPGGLVRMGGTAPATAGRAGAAYTLTVNGTNLAGRPDTGDAVVVANVDDVNVLGGFIGKTLKNGVATFTVPAGHYIVAGFFLTTSGRHITGQHIVVLPQVTVSGGTTVSVAARSADREVRMATPRPASLLWQTLDIYRDTASHQLLGIDAPSVGQGPIWISPVSTPVSTGTLRTVAAAGLASRPGIPAPYIYDLVFSSAGGVIPAEHWVVRPAQLATVTARYYQAVPSSGLLYLRGLLPFQAGIIFGGEFPLRLPSRVTEYVTGGSPIVWFDEYAQARSRWTGGQISAHRSYLAGERVTQSWGAYPLQPAPDVSVLGAADPWARFVPQGVVPSAARMGSKLLLSIDPFGDSQPGHIGGGYTSGRYQIDQNGTRIAGGNAVQRPGPWAFLRQVKLSPDPSLIRFTLATARAGTLSGGQSDPLSTVTRTVWTWRSAAEPGVKLPLGWWCGAGPVSRSGVGSRACAVQPMMTLRYAVQNLALDGSAPAGLQLVRLAVGHVQLARATRIVRVTARVSFDGGTTWQDARVIGRNGRYTIVFSAPPGARVTLGVSAADAAGGSVTQMVTSAYATAAG
jgi:hypothetical protein